MSGHIYLIREREFINSGKPIYKIGKTCQKDPRRRIASYPKGSECIILIKKDNVELVEKRLIKQFTNFFIKRSDIGAEYFEGNKETMTKLIFDYQVSNTDIDECELYDLNILINQYEKYMATICSH